MIKRCAAATIALAITLAPVTATLAHANSLADTVRTGSVRVTVNYKGKGTVNESHRLWVWLFDTPNIGPGSMPIAQMSLDKNGTVAQFESVAPDQVWIAVAFDENGVMTGNEPPPPGTPVSVFGIDTGAPAPVTTGAKGEATITFDDSLRMQ